MKEDDKEFDLSDAIGGTLNILGLKLDLAKLLSAPEDVRDGLEQLRERLKEAGGREVLSDEEWRKGRVSVSGQVRTRGVLGEREYHIGTGGAPSRPARAERQPQPPEVVEPAVDVFHEAEEVVIVAEVPGVELADLELEVQDSVLSLSTKAAARRRYHKRIDLASKVDTGSLTATCRNGILEVHVQKAAS